MRGKVDLGVPLPVYFRITPAYAGKRVIVSSSFHSLRDHPRVCGEKTKKIP